MSIPRKIAYNVIVSSTAKMLSTIAALVGIGFITRYLGKDGFGMYTIALAFFALFGAVGDFGLYQVTTRDISRPGADEEKIVGNVATLRIMISIIILLLTPVVLLLIDYPKELKMGILLVGFSYIFSSFYQVLIGLFQKRLMMDRVTIAEFFGKVTQVALIVLGVHFDWGFGFIVGTLLVNMIVNFSIVFIIARKFVRFRLHFDISFWKSFLKQSWPLGLSAIVTFIYFRADTILLSIFRSPEDVGIYGAAYKVIENISFFPAMIVGLTMPMFSLHINSDFERFRMIVNKNFKVFLILVVPLVIGTVFFSDFIIRLIAGPEFQASAVVLRIIIFALGFIFFGNLFNNVLIAAKLQKQLLYILSFCAAFNLTTNLIFIPKYSYLTTSVTSVLTELLVITLSLWVMKRRMNFLPRLESAGPILLSGILMAAYLWFFRSLPSLFLIVSSPALYFGLLVLLKVVSKQELLSLISKKPRIEVE